MQDLAIDPHVVKTLDLDGPIKRQDISAPESENEITAVSVIDQVSHNDNKELDRQPRRRNKSTTSSKDATKRNKSKGKSASKENVVAKPVRPSNTTFTGLSRKSVERKRSTSQDKSVRRSTERTAKPMIKAVTPTTMKPAKSPQLDSYNAGYMSSSTVAVPEPIILL